MTPDRTTVDWLLALLRAQRDAGFADLAGADVSLTLPVSDRLINQVIVERLPRGGVVSAVEVEALPANQFAVRVKLGQSVLLPPIRLVLAIDRQPDLPAFPVIGLRIVSPGLAALVGSLVARFFHALPPWVQFDGTHISIDLLAAAAASAVGAEVFGYLRALALTTAAGRVTVSIRASVPATTDGR
jgi:hypothetical protein